MSYFLITLLVNAVVVTVCFLLVWLWQIKSKNAGVVDAVWGIIFPIQAFIYFISAGNYSLRNEIILGLIAFWGLRLGIYLGVRNIGKAEDKRYAEIREKAGSKANQTILSFYMIQVGLAIGLFLPVYFIFANETAVFSIFDVVGMGILAIAALCEAIADEQLRMFKSKPANRGQICDRGLWYYSRHPNYFFEWMAWVGIFVLSLNVEWGFVAILAPVFMLYLLTKGTGVSMTEAVILSTKSEKYRAYMASTSAFFPWKKLKAASER